MKLRFLVIFKSLYYEKNGSKLSIFNLVIRASLAANIWPICICIWIEHGLKDLKTNISAKKSFKEILRNLWFCRSLSIIIWRANKCYIIFIVVFVKLDWLMQLFPKRFIIHFYQRLYTIELLRTKSFIK